MYLCETCGTAFDAPDLHRESLREDGYVRTETLALCPICLQPYFTEADLCGVCRDRYKPRNAHLCHPCRDDLLRRFTDFADSLTAEEEQQLDHWLDGDSVTGRRKWK